MITVNHYGLHWIEGDIGLLVQGKGQVDHALDVPLHYDVTVRIPRQGLYCPHKIDLTGADRAVLPDDPLVRFMSPTPKEFGEKAMWLEDQIDHKETIQELFRLTGGGTMLPLFGLNPGLAAAHLNLTNLQPLVIFGLRQEYMSALSKIVEASYVAPRRLLLIGPRYAAPARAEVERMETEVYREDVHDLPLERMGAWLLRQHMLGK